MTIDGTERTASDLPTGRRVSVCVVLSAGGLRGAAHVGVLRELVRQGIQIDSIVGVSAGAVIAAYYAAVGLDFDDLIRDASIFRGRHLLVHSVNVRLGHRCHRYLSARCGVIPERLRQLDQARFDRLHHGVRRLGIVCHDVGSGAPQYFATGRDYGVTLAAAVRASASIPFLFPVVPVTANGRQLRLTDGGVSDPLPLAFARSAAIGGTHLVVSDCRWIGFGPPSEPTTVWIRPRMLNTGTLWSPMRGLASAVRDGETAVTEALDRISPWFFGRPARAHP